MIRYKHSKFTTKLKSSQSEPMPRHKARYLEIVRLKEEGKTLKEIADIMGFKCTGSVSNILGEHGRAKNNG